MVKQSDGKGHTTAYRYNNYGQPVQITDAKNNGYFFDYDDDHRLSSTTDCSGKQTRYQYDGKGRVATITDAAGGTTAYRYNSDGQLENTTYPDGSSEHYHYDEAGRLKAHTDAAGNRTEYAYNSDNQPVERTNALGDTFRYRYDAARRLTELINENGDSYRFAYDERDRLTAETGFDGRATEYTYNPAGELVQENRYGQTHRFGNHRRELLQTTIYHRDRLGRITQKDSHHTDSTRSDSSRYFYDKLNRLTRACNAHSDLRLSYNSDGLLVKEQYQTLGEPIQPGIIRPRTQDGIPLVTEYRYDILGNRTQTILPTGETLNYLYYGSGHLHHINLDGDIITDIERDDLHRPVSRSAGKLHTRLISDPLGRLKEQLVQLEATNGKATEPKGLIKRRYHYDAVGNLTQTEDRHHGNKDYAYDPLGRITRAGDERFAFDPAHNISGDGVKVAGNRLTDYNGIRYVYDQLGNLSERHNDATGESQYYRYDADNQLTEARIEQTGRPSEHWHYRYDALGRRVSKQNVHNQTETRFLWEGSRLLQEYSDKATYTYVYTEQGSYEPLAQIVQTANRDGSKTDRQILYYHNDQIGIPRELTDAEGNIVWRGEYSGWGKLNNAEGTNLKEDVHQPFRLQNQYADEETGLHYNFFRYYDPHCGRFTQQDPIKLVGGENLYQLAPNVSEWIDVLGLNRRSMDGVDEFGDWSGASKAIVKGKQTGTPFIEVSCAAGLGGSFGLEFPGKGRVVTSTAITSGAGCGYMAGFSQSNRDREDGLFSEVCETASAGYAYGSCQGNSLKKGAKPYISNKIGTGTGTSITGNIGYQKTFDFRRKSLEFSPNSNLQNLDLPNGFPSSNSIHPNSIIQNIPR